MHPQDAPTSGAHVTRKRGVFYYRRRRPAPSDGEVGFSLRTSNYRRAEYLAARLDTRLAVYLGTTMSNDKLHEIAREYLRDMLKQDEAHRSLRKPGKPLYTHRADDDPLDADGDILARLLSDAREALAQNDMPVHLVELALTRTVEHGLAPDEVGPLARLLLRAQIEGLEDAIARLHGRYPPLDLEPPRTHGAPPAQVPTGPLLSTRIPSFEAAMSAMKKPEKSGGKARSQWSPHTAGQNKNTLARFIEICGDRPAASYTVADVGRFLDTMAKLPEHYGRSKTSAGKPVAQMIAEAAKSGAAGGLSRATIERHKTTISKLFLFAIQQGDRTDNPVAVHRFMTNEVAAKRGTWDSDRIAKFFASALFTGAKSEARRMTPGPHIYWDEYYWLPLLGLYHGNRVEEFAQLRRRDLEREGRVWFFRITDDGANTANSVKNASSRRRVPIHARLLELGLIDYIKAVAPREDMRLFPRMLPGGKGKKLAHYYSKRFTEHRRQAGVYKRWVDYHSFRHGVESQLGAAPDVQARFIDALLGHLGEGTGQTVYFDREQIPVGVLKALVDRVGFPELVMKRAPNPAILR